MVASPHIVVCVPFFSDDNRPLSSKKVLPRVFFTKPVGAAASASSQQLVADVRSGMERLVVEYATESMLNIVPGRNSALGPSQS